MGRTLFFYSQWPIGFYNPEGERKAIALADGGYDVSYAAGIGFRNPSLARPRKAVDVATRKLRGGGARPGLPGSEKLGRASLLVAPPRQLPPVRRLNARWVERQLRAQIPDWAEVLAWLRYPSPELVDAIARLRPRAVVYECVDAYDHTPGIVGSWRERFHHAERAVAELADVVVVSSEALAERLRPYGTEVRVVPHGVELELFTWPPPQRPPQRPITAGYIGTIDTRIDVAALRHVAARNASWHIRLVGPVRDGFDVRRLGDLPNLSVEPPVPHARLGEVMATFDAGLMPYLNQPTLRYMCPVKNLELLAAGKPAVARPNPALRRYSELLYFASTPEEFAAQLERAVDEDSPALAARRRAVAEQNSWRSRLDEVVQIASGLAAP